MINLNKIYELLIIRNYPILENVRYIYLVRARIGIFEIKTIGDAIYRKKQSYRIRKN